jgi:hypothetical protein
LAVARLSSCAAAVLTSNNIRSAKKIFLFMVQNNETIYYQANPDPILTP